MIDPTTIEVVLIIFIATVIRSAFGFGEALVAVPLLTLCIPVEVAAPLAVLVSVMVALVVVAQDWRKIHVRSAGWLIAATIFGIPLGLLLLTHANPRLIKALLAALIISFSVYSLTARKVHHLVSDNRFWLLLCGFCAGVMGGAYGMNGPPLAIYGSFRRWSPQHFRATLQAYFLPASIFGLTGYWLAGLWVPAVTRYFLFSLPLALLGILLGRAINHRLHGNTFLRYVYLGLIAIGGVLMAQAIRH